jgi:hypothetical protein
MDVDGGYHESQFLTKDTLAVRNDAHFGAASVLCSYRTQKRGKKEVFEGGTITLEEKGIFRGMILSFSDTSVNKTYLKPSIILGKKCEIHGAIVTDGEVWLHSTVINGPVYARGIISDENRISYKNFLFNVRVNPSGQSILCPLLEPLPLKIQIIKTS